MTLLKYYLNQFLLFLEIGDLTVAIVYVVLTINNFWAAATIYDTIIFEVFSKNEKLLHELFKYCRKIFENTVYGWVEGIKDIALALLAGFIPMLPSFMKMPLDFLGVTEYI